MKIELYAGYCRRGIFVFGLFSLFLIAMTGCDSSKDDSLSFDTEYQAVMLDNGHAYFGKLTRVDSQYMKLTNIYYVQQQKHKETGETKNTLIRRGKEWHEPDYMIINTSHIVFIENVGPNSDVVKAIEGMSDT
jgi:small nuclear ribonucleoprotein (snRNP)-like protein